jgi:hypothetical protein
MSYEILSDKIEWEWGDGSLVTLDWFQEAGCFCADRWLYDDDVEGEVELADDCVIGPYDFWFLESLESLEEALGRPLPSDVRAALTAWSEADPFTEEDRENWGGMVASASRGRRPKATGWRPSPHRGIRIRSHVTGFPRRRSGRWASCSHRGALGPTSVEPRLGDGLGRDIETVGPSHPSHIPGGRGRSMGSDRCRRCGTGRRRHRCPPIPVPLRRRIVGLSRCIRAGSAMPEGPPTQSRGWPSPVTFGLAIGSSPTGVTSTRRRV